jgi:hypothetical protein
MPAPSPPRKVLKFIVSAILAIHPIGCALAEEVNAFSVILLTPNGAGGGWVYFGEPSLPSDRSRSEAGLLAVRCSNVDRRLFTLRNCDTSARMSLADDGDSLSSSLVGASSSSGSRSSSVGGRAAKVEVDEDTELAFPCLRDSCGSTSVVGVSIGVGLSHAPMIGGYQSSPCRRERGPSIWNLFSRLIRSLISDGGSNNSERTLSLSHQS